MFFPESVVREAVAALAGAAVVGPSRTSWENATTETGDVSWSYDNDAEFFIDYKPSVSSASIEASVYTVEKPTSGYQYPNGSLKVNVYSYPWPYTTVSVNAPARSALLRPFEVLRAWAEKTLLLNPSSLIRRQYLH